MNKKQQAAAAKQAAIEAANTAAVVSKANATDVGKAISHYAVKHVVGRFAGKPVSRSLTLVHAMWNCLRESATAPTYDELKAYCVEAGFINPGAKFDQQIGIETGNPTYTNRKPRYKWTATKKNAAGVIERTKASRLTLCDGCQHPVGRTEQADGSQRLAPVPAVVADVATT